MHHMNQMYHMNQINHMNQIYHMNQINHMNLFITFEVEIGLDKPKEFLRSENIDKILNSLYERKIKYCSKEEMRL